MSERSNDAGQPDDGQTHRNRLFGIEIEHVDQNRHRQNRATAAERPQEDADQPREYERDLVHHRFTSVTRTAADMEVCARWIARAGRSHARASSPDRGAALA